MAEGKLTGGLTNYYLVDVKHPQRAEQSPYRAECEDIAEALQLTPNEFCEFRPFGVLLLPVWAMASQITRPSTTLRSACITPNVILRSTPESYPNHRRKNRAALFWVALFSYIWRRHENHQQLQHLVVTCCMAGT